MCFLLKTCCDVFRSITQKQIASIFHCPTIEHLSTRFWSGLDVHKMQNVPHSQASLLLLFIYTEDQ